MRYESTKYSHEVSGESESVVRIKLSSLSRLEKGVVTLGGSERAPATPVSFGVPSARGTATLRRIDIELCGIELCGNARTCETGGISNPGLGGARQSISY
jgi:hypothetical protein